MNKERWWLKALLLKERNNLLKQLLLYKNKCDLALGKQRLEKWKSQLPFKNSPDIFLRRLRVEGIKKKFLLYILGEIPESLSQSLPRPPWVNKFLKIYSNYTFSKKLPVPKSLSKHEKKILGFLNVVKPLINHTCHQIQNTLFSNIKTKTDILFTPSEVEKILTENLIINLLRMLDRTMTLELNIARLKKSLKGKTPEIRFRNFMNMINDKTKAVEILQEYPVLIRQIMKKIDNYANSMTEFFFRLHSDWKIICNTFQPKETPGKLKYLQQSGDSHCGGRSVLIATFENNFKVVYKPRSLSIDKHFQRLLRWLNQYGIPTKFKTLKIIDKKNYGWVEFIPFKSCKHSVEVKKFYERLGGYLALLYVLEATDFHYENLIANGEHPMLVDLESLFQPPSDANSKQSPFLVSNIIAHSVLKIGLLPQRIWSSDDYIGIDISGISEVKDQFWPDELPSLEKIGTDEMFFSRKRFKIKGGHNRPQIKGKKVNPIDYQEAMVKGFITVYRILMNNKNRLLSPNGPIMCFSDDEIRILFRPTRIYALMLYESFHPDFLRNWLDRLFFLDKLWIGVKNMPFIEKLIPFEYEDIENLDIPLFKTKTDSCDLRSSSDKRIVKFFNNSGMSLVQNRIDQLSEKNLSLQVWLIRASLSTLSLHLQQTKGPFRQKRNKLLKFSDQKMKSQLINIAKRIGDRLEALAFYDSNNASWLGLTLLNQYFWQLTPLANDLYSGLPGIILFLAYLGMMTNEKKYIELSEKAFVTLLESLRENHLDNVAIGAFTGIGGIIYMLTHLAVLWHKKDLFYQAYKYVKLVQRIIEKDKQYDILGGAAGCIAALISLFNCFPRRNILTVAVMCGDLLIKCAQRTKKGVGWIIPLSIKPLTGFAHGAAGIAWILLKLSSISKKNRFRKIAFDAILYERSYFLAKENNWADLRPIIVSTKNKKGRQKSIKTAWCTGATGIGLARVDTLPLLDDSVTRREIDIALETTIREGFGFNHSLCHGDLGNLELLLQIIYKLKKTTLISDFKYLTAMIINDIEQNGWRCGVDFDIETPGLMVGLAGIGYQLLRIAEPDRVPSILLLEPPVCN